jgi:YVTN family beta-propeller protein
MSLLAVWPVKAQTVTGEITVGNSPFAVAANPVTGKIYVANRDSGTVTVINGATNQTTTVTDPLAALPMAVAVNPVANLIYVTNATSGNVTVIDGSTDTVAADISVEGIPMAVAVNPVTNRAYVASIFGTVSVISGTAFSSNIFVGQGLASIAVNPVTNRIYVADCGLPGCPPFPPGGPGEGVSIINGATSAVTTVVDPNAAVPYAVAVNPVTNMVYVGNLFSHNVTVINGLTNTISTTLMDTNADMVQSLAVNPVTNKIYAPSDGGYTVIDGATNTFTRITDANAINPNAVAVDPVNNQIYVANQGSGDTGQSVTVIAGTTGSVKTLALSPATPYALAVNPVTNKLYVANANTDYVNVIDGATYAVTTASNANFNFPQTSAVNPITNKAYVLNGNNTSITVIDGNTGLTTSVTDANASQPTAVAVNPLTNKIYIANEQSNNVTVIDGATNTTQTVADPNALFPGGVAVNPVTNKIYVANDNYTLTLIDGSTNTTTTIFNPTGGGSLAVAVNPNTNQIFVANNAAQNVTVFDGTTNTLTATLSLADYPYYLAVNPLTNKVYVVNENSVGVVDGSALTYTPIASMGSTGSPALNPVTNQLYVPSISDNKITVIDGATNTTRTLTDSNASEPYAADVNPLTNKIYVSNLGSGNVTVIDGATGAMTDVTDPNAFGPCGVVVNPVAGKAFVSNCWSNNVSVISEQQVAPVPLWANITPLQNNATPSQTPGFDFTAGSNFNPTAPPPDNLLFQVDSWQGPWTAAESTGPGAFSGTVTAPRQGFHILYAYATDGQEATSTMGSSNNGAGTSPLVSNITAYGFVVAMPSATLTPLAGLSFGSQPLNEPGVSQYLTLTDSGGPLSISSISITGANAADFSEFDDCPSGGETLAGGASCRISVTFTPSLMTAESASLTVTDDSGGVNGATQVAALSGTGALNATTTSISAPTVTYPSSASVTVTVTSSQGNISGNASLAVDSGSPLTQSLSNGSATFTVSGLQPGTHSLSASYATQGNFAASSATGSLYVRKAQPTVSITGIPAGNVAAYRSIFTVGSTTNASTTGVITVSGVCTISGITVTMTSGTGTCVVSANWASDADYLAASTNQSVTATKAHTMTAITAHTPSSSVTGQGISVSFRVSPVEPATNPPTGNVTVSDGTGESCTASVAAGSCTITPMTAGAKTLTASYSGDDIYYSPSTSMGTSQTVNEANTKTTITHVSASSTVVGQPVTFQFTVVPLSPGSGTPTGNVTISDEAGDTCTTTVAAGSCSISFAAAGNKTLQASYAGDASYNSSASASVSDSVLDFAMSTNPPLGIVLPGSNTSGSVITVTPLDGFRGTVALSCQVSPSAIPCTVSPSSVTMTGNGIAYSRITIKTIRSTPPGNNTVTVTGTYGSGTPASGGLTHTTSISLTVK